MNVEWVQGRPSSECSRGRADHVTTPGCGSITAATVDPAVAGCLLAALSGQEVELALAAADEVTGRRTRAVRAAELAVERARYEAGRAERALLACEPENRLVARTFEARLEAKLGELAEAEAALTTVTAAKAPLPPRAELEAAVATLGGLWSAPTTTDRDRKRLLRTLIADVPILAGCDPATVRIRGPSRPRASQELPPPPVPHTCPPPPTCPTRTEPGPAPARRAAPRSVVPFPPEAEAACRQRIATSPQIHPADTSPPAPDELSPAAVAARLHISRDAVYHWIDHGHLPARRGPGGRYYIRFTAEDEAACRQRIATSSQLPPKIKAQALQSVPGGAL